MGSRVAMMVALLVLELFVPVASQASSVGDNQGSTIAAWVDTLPIDKRVTDGIELFAHAQRSAFDEGYASRLAAGIRGLIAADAGAALKRIFEGERHTSIQVAILKPGFAFGGGKAPGDVPGVAPGNATERDFEESFVRIEVVAFFERETASPAAALDLYTNEEFRRTVSSRIRRIWNEGGEICYQVGGVTLMVHPVDYCDRIEDLRLEEISSQHAQTVRNAGGKGNQAVYFKESLKTFRRLPDGLAFHYVSYSRTVGAGGIRGRLARVEIEDSEKKALEELGRRLASRRPTTAR